jgi:hypothetical protein
VSLRIEGTRAIYDDGRIVVERTPHGWSIAHNDPNPETRYLPTRLTLRERLTLWRWQRRMTRHQWHPERAPVLAVDKGAERSEATAFSVDPSAVSSCSATSSVAPATAGPETDDDGSISAATLATAYQSIVADYRARVATLEARLRDASGPMSKP